MEERNDDVPQVAKSGHAVPEKIFPVIVMTAIDRHMSASEEAEHVLQHSETAGSLHNHESGLHLPAERRAGIPKDRAAKAAFSVDEPHDPSVVQESFLLIFRVPHIVTAVPGDGLQLRCITPMGDE